ncbi:MAG TPA: hypothetical protein DCP92_06285 [Nitrospiraceae bacterium]|nr:hypothetical protein [Nitrospiraceae bacterium]
MPHRLSLHALEIISDHVHLFLNAPPSLAPDRITHWLKGSTSHRLRRTYSHLKRSARKCDGP